MKRTALIIGMIFLAGCAHVISDEMRARADEGIEPRALFQRPGAYIGKTVILGGVIIGSKNTDEGSYIEVLQKPLDNTGRPTGDDMSYGRFIIFSKSYLETNIYSQGRAVTVAGKLTGTSEGKVGEMKYTYPVVKAEELRLHEPRSGGSPFRFSIGIWHVF